MGREVFWGQEDGSGATALSTIDGILKEDYVRDQIINTVNMQTYFLSKLGSKDTTHGRRFVLGARFGVSEGQGFRKENEALPETGFGEYDQPTGNVVLQYSPFNISGPAIKATKGNRAAFADALSTALQDTRDGFALATYWGSWGDGTGTLGKVGTGAASATQQVTSPLGLDYVTGSLENSQKTRPFRKNMKLLFVTTGAVRTITSVNGDGTITLNATITTTTGERIVRGDSTALSDDAKSLLGVTAAVKATGSYFNISRSGQPGWQGNIIDLNDEPLTEDALQLAFDTADINGDGAAAPNLLISEHLARRLYIQLLESRKRFVTPSTKLEGGFTALDFNGKPWVVDKACPPQRVFYLNMPDWTWYVMQDVDWMQEDGKVLKWVNGYDKYTAILHAYRQLACLKPANQTVLQGVTRISESV